MPIYEYICGECKKKQSFLILNRNEPFTEKCSHCGGTNLIRIMSRFAVVKSEESRLESLADPAKWGDIDEKDPESMMRMMRRMGKEFGEELGEDFDQALEEAEMEMAQEKESENKESEDKEGSDTGDFDTTSE